MYPQENLFKSIHTYNEGAANNGTTTITIAEGDVAVVSSFFISALTGTITINIGGTPLVAVASSTLWNGNCFYVGEEGENVTIVGSGDGTKDYAVTVGILNEVHLPSGRTTTTMA
jgi:hypothetical protein